MQTRRFEELYRVSPRPRISLFFRSTPGCWLISRLLPANYRAASNLYIALNPYRTYEDANFLANVNPEYTNLDDYKNWQMAQLDSAVYLDDFMQVTLDRLKEQDQRWQDVDISQLRKMLRAEWRTAGNWSLVADTRDAELADQAAEMRGGLRESEHCSKVGERSYFDRL
jgi:hypothetical protein